MQDLFEAVRTDDAAPVDTSPDAVRLPERDRAYRAARVRFESWQLRCAVAGEDSLVEEPEDATAGLDQQPTRDAVW